MTDDEAMTRVMLSGGAMLWPHVLLLGWLKRRSELGPGSPHDVGRVIEPLSAVAMGGTLPEVLGRSLPSPASDPESTWRLINRRQRRRIH